MANFDELEVDWSHLAVHETGADKICKPNRQNCAIDHCSQIGSRPYDVTMMSDFDRNASRHLFGRSLVLVGIVALGGCYADAEDGRILTDSDATDSNASDSDATATDTAMGTDSDGVEIAAENMIDDLEDCDDAIIQQEGRGGSWYSYNDGTAGGSQTPSGTQSPASGGVEGSDMCSAMTMGSGFTEWGSGVGFDLINDGTAPKEPYDASVHSGVAFWVRGDAADVRFNVLMPGVLPESEGGTCVPSSPEAADCSDAHGVVISVTDEWQQYSIDFTSLTQGGWGQPVAFDSGTIMSMHWYIPQDQDFELALDDIGFY